MGLEHGITHPSSKTIKQNKNPLHSHDSLGDPRGIGNHHPQYCNYSAGCMLFSLIGQGHLLPTLAISLILAAWLLDNKWRGAQLHWKHNQRQILCDIQHLCSTVLFVLASVLLLLLEACASESTTHSISACSIGRISTNAYQQHNRILTSAFLLKIMCESFQSFHPSPILYETLPRSKALSARVSFHYVRSRRHRWKDGRWMESNGPNKFNWDTRGRPKEWQWCEIIPVKSS